MDANRVKEIKDKLLSDKISFVVVTDENYSFQHVANNESSRVFFDDASETAIAIKLDDYGNLNHTLFEYERILHFEVSCSNEYNKAMSTLKTLENIKFIPDSLVAPIKEFIENKFYGDKK